MNVYREVERMARAEGVRGIAPCHTAHVMSLHGLTKRQAHNRIDPNSRAKPCPASKWSHIEAALRKIGKLR
jgi:hypothetical protein